jgi:hypothetical protein
VTGRVEPDRATRATYDELYQEFRALHKQTRPIYARLHADER